MSDNHGHNSAPTKRGRGRPGQASIDKIIVDADKDRVSSVEALEGLKFETGPPGVRAIKSLWTARFNAFRTHVLQQSLDVPFTGTDIIRFLDSVIGKLDAVDSGKPVPSLSIIHTACNVLRKYGEFRWSQFTFTPHDTARLESWINQAVENKRLHFISRGTDNFDIVVYKCLYVVLVAALGCRGGDVARSNGYKGREYLQYHHIELYLESGAKPEYKNLCGIVTLEYVKGSKDKVNASQVRYLKPLDDSEFIHVDPIALLLVHCLRNGLVHGTTVQEVLNNAAARPDRHVQWKHPGRPVLTAWARKPKRYDLDTVTGPHQITNTIKLMGMLCGLLGRAYGHALRLGAARDFAHLPTRNTHAITDEVRNYLGHSHAAAAAGTTERYVGNLYREVWNERAEGGGVQHHREPRFAVDGSAQFETVEQPVTREEIQTELDENGSTRDIDSLTIIEKKTIHQRVRRKRLEAFNPSAMAEPRGHQPGAAPSLPMSHPLTPISVNIPRRPAIGNVNGTTPISEKTHTCLCTNDNDPTNLWTLEPVTLDENSLEQVDASESDINALQAVVFSANDDGGTMDSDEDEALDEYEGLRGVATNAAMREFDEEAAGVVLGMSTTALPTARNAVPTTPTSLSTISTTSVNKTAPNTRTSPATSATAVIVSAPLIPISVSSAAHEWIDSYAKYNVVKNSQFAIQWKEFYDGEASFDESVGNHSMRGNSRNEPSPYMFHCRQTPACTYRTIKLGLLEQHEGSCNDDLVAAAAHEEPDTSILRCDHPGCSFETSSGRRSLEKHRQDTHDWIPKPCEHGCEPGKIYLKKSAYTDHQIKIHSGRWPAVCSFPECTEQKQFKDQHTLAYHLTKAHGLTDAQARLPYLPPIPAKRQWIVQSCFKSGCTNTTMMPSKSRMLLHLTSYHKLETDAADDLIEKNAKFEMVTPKARVLGPAGNAKKRSKDRAFTDADEAEDAPSARGAAKRSKKQTSVEEDEFEDAPLAGITKKGSKKQAPSKENKADDAPSRLANVQAAPKKRKAKK
ncbi:hypothetical protein B9Z65_6412 [Elsinoe australis]|uniref:C2H2-type domain-containing protein n=1 Tax=Elsinoe australis TaxID=40998 RepID=A0A2P8A8L5_9PEZI|nr:hypothetical protein B9Z65_6412 [Elsinoe australis]